MYDHALHHGRKHFGRYCKYVFSTEEILKRHIKDCFLNFFKLPSELSIAKCVNPKLTKRMVTLERPS